MHVAIGIKQDIVGFHIAMNNVLTVNVAECTSQFGNPESHRVFGEGLSRDVES